MAAGQKLELTWIGKDKEERVEPRILIYDKEKSYGDQNTGNMLIHGDNLLALKSLEQEYAGKIKCVYIDPPFNTGAAFDHYDDNVEHSIWLGLMKKRLEMIKILMANDGAIFINLDDSESAYMKVLMDEIFGRKNYKNEIIVSTNSSFGFKSTSDALFKQANHILFYVKNKEAFQLNTDKAFVEKPYDIQYKWVFFNTDKNEKEWVWRNIKDVVCEELGFINAKKLTIEQKERLKERTAIYAIENADKVFRTASVTGGALLKRKDTIKYSKEHKKIIVRHPNDDMDYIFIGGERVIYYKERLKEIDGEMLPGTLLTDIWDDVPIEGLSTEGGVKFPKGKKPEKLIQRCIELTSANGDWILDSFLGSGTTAAVAQKMNRRYIGVEMGEHCYTHCKARLDKVVDGEQSGISKAVNWQGGGGYRFYELAPSLLKKDEHNQWIFDYDAYEPEQRETMIAEAIAKLNGYQYAPNDDVFWKQGMSHPGSYIYTTTQYISATYLDEISKSMNEDERLLVCCPAFDNGLGDRYDNIVVKKIPQTVLDKCEFGRNDYKINIIETPDINKEEDEVDDDE